MQESVLFTVCHTFSTCIRLISSVSLDVVVNTLIKLHCSTVHFLFPGDNTDNTGLDKEKNGNYGKELVCNFKFNFPIHEVEKAEGGRELMRLIQPPYSQQHHLEQAGACVQSGFEYLQGWSFHTPTWASCASVTSPLQF